MPTSPESAWVKLNPTAFAKRERERFGGVEINIVMSPYHVPDAVRGRYDVATKRFLIEFKYIDDEKATDERADQHIAFRVGKNSGRLLAVLVDVDALGAKQVGVRMHVTKVAVSDLVQRLKGAIGQLSQAHKADPSRINNYEVAEDVIDDQKGELFRELVEA